MARWRLAPGKEFSFANSTARASVRYLSKSCASLNGNRDEGQTCARRDMVKFLIAHESRHLHSGALLPDQMHLLQFPHRCSVTGEIRAVRLGCSDRDSRTSAAACAGW